MYPPSATSQSHPHVQYFAHSKGANGSPEPMKQHIDWVSKLAGEYAQSFDAQEECKFAGRLHDLGKYGDKFQDRLKGIGTGIDHWSAGAYEAIMLNKIAVALAIQGHHIGLQKGDRESLGELNIADLGKRHPQNCKLSTDNHPILASRARAEGVEWEAPSKSCFDMGLRATDPVGQMLAVRMLFSALVDADFVATERHFGGESASATKRAALPLDPHSATLSLAVHIDAIRRQSQSADIANNARHQVLEACRSSGAGPKGLFTLNAPTGSGKTLAMLTWALEQCRAHTQLRRIIVVLPYLTIMEQTAQVYREALANWLSSEWRNRGILEHHSLSPWRTVGKSGNVADDEQSADASHARYLAENWDAPIVITSNVQFFESLFANSPSACRKLHRIANSAILFDEVQTLPPSLLIPTLGAVSTLVSKFGCSVVLATATQPAFSHLSSQVERLACAGYRAEPIIADPVPLFRRTKRNNVHWPKNAESQSWDELSQQMLRGRQALCILNLKRHAQELFAIVQEAGAEGTVHLSTAMCPGHRSAVLTEVRRRLRENLPCILIATQCVEAGVDLDFPAVFRAFAPLDAIAQAAGRANRNGILSAGDVWIFHPDDTGTVYPDRTYEQAATVTAELLARHGGELNIDDPNLFDLYFRNLYDIRDLENANPNLVEAIKNLNFVRVAELYKMIDRASINIVTPWDLSEFETLAKEVRNDRLTAGWIQRARNFTVNAYRPVPAAPEWSHLEPIRAGRNKAGENKDAVDWFLLRDSADYDNQIGLQFQKGLAFLGE